MESPAASLTASGLRRQLQRLTAYGPLCAGSGLLLLIAAHLPWQQQQLTPWSLVALGAGIALWLVALLVAPPHAQPLDHLIVQPQALRWPLLVAALLLAALTWRYTTAGVYTRLNVGLWISTIIVWCAAWWPERSQADTLSQQRRAWSFLYRLWPLAVCLLVGAFFRFYRLYEIPADPTSDHAEKLLDIYDLINGQRPIFFPRNTGREPGQFYITFALIKLVGLPLTFGTLKLGTAIIGLLAIPAVWLFAYEIGGRATAIFATALFAISKWMTNISRMGLRYPYGVLPTALALWLLLRYLRRGDRRDALLCGLVIGLGLQGYISFRIVPLLVPLCFGTAWLLDRRWRAQWRRLLLDGVLIAGTALLTCLPLARYSAQYPEQVWYRVATRAASTERDAGSLAQQITTFARNNLNALLAFNWRGDVTVVNAVQYDPFLDVVSSAAVLAGVLLLAAYLRRRNLRAAYLLLALPVLMLPSTLSLAFPIENPSANRIGTVGPVIFVLAALPFAYLVQQITTLGAATRRFVQPLAYGLIGLLLMAAGALNYLRYFRDFDQQYRTYVPNSQQVAATIRGMSGQGVPIDNAYLLAFPYWLDGRNVAFALGDIRWRDQHDLLSEMPLPPRPVGQPLLFIVNLADTERLKQLTARFPDGTFSVMPSVPQGKEFIVYYVPPQ